MSRPYTQRPEQAKDRAYDHIRKYEVLQGRIDAIEANAKAKHGALAKYQLETAEEYWLYRDLCADRDREMRIAQLYATMAMLG